MSLADSGIWRLSMGPATTPVAAAAAATKLEKRMLKGSRNVLLGWMGEDVDGQVKKEDEDMRGCEDGAARGMDGVGCSMRLDSRCCGRSPELHVRAFLASSQIAVSATAKTARVP